MRLVVRGARRRWPHRFRLGSRPRPRRQRWGVSLGEFIAESRPCVKTPLFYFWLVPDLTLSGAHSSPVRGKPKERVGGRSIFENLFRLIEQDGPLVINFEDVSGVTFDVPDLVLSSAARFHGCKFCVLAKRTRETHFDCVRNKLATNRIAVRRLAGFTGLCHLGMTDIVEPLVYRQRVLGVFYYGSVVVRGTETEARRRIIRYCQRRKLEPSPLLTAFRKAPKIDRTDLSRYRERLILAAEFAVRVLDAQGLPLERYRTEMGAQFLHSRIDILPLVQNAMRYIHRNYTEPLEIAAIARYVKCHPDYLSRVFKKSVTCGLSEYVLRVRIDRARHLIDTKRFSIGEIAWNVGFQDQSHFGRVFKRLLGVSPGRYVGSAKPERLGPEQSIDQPDFSRLRTL